MNFQNIGRYIFLILLVVLAVYFMHVNKNYAHANNISNTKTKNKPIEHFEDAASTQVPTPLQPTYLSAKESEALALNKAIDLTDLSNNNDSENIDIIKEIYKKLFNQVPQQSEITFYLDYIKSKHMSLQQLEDLIATTAPVLRKTIPDDSKMRYGTEDEVIIAYNEVLGRNPTPEELKQHAEMLKNTKDFTIDKLIQLLVSSAEYNRLEKMQLNTYNAGLLSGVTDRQITLTVEADYAEITGTPIDAATLAFLKNKFIEFNLDENKLKVYIKNLVLYNPVTSENYKPLIKNEAPLSQYLNNSPGSSLLPNSTPNAQATVPTIATSSTAANASSGGSGSSFGGSSSGGSSSTGSTIKSTSTSLQEQVYTASESKSTVNLVPTTQNTNILSSQVVLQEMPQRVPQVYQEVPQEVYQEVLQEVYQEGLLIEPMTQQEKKEPTVIYNNAQIYNVYSLQDSGALSTGEGQPNKELIAALLKNMNKDSDNYVDSQAVLDTINKKAQCTFNVNGRQKDETLLSDQIALRNKEQMGSVCKRNTAFLNADSDYILRPDQAWTVPIKRQPVCAPISKCQVTESIDQTSLIGTLLNDSQKTSVGSILPYLPPR